MSTALVGTDRAGPPAWAPPGTADPAAGLLEVAAVLAVSRRAGKPAVRDLVPATPAPDEVRPEAGKAAAKRLITLLDGHVFDADTRGELVREWLTLAGRAAVIAPPATLPALLDAGRASIELRPWLAAASGARARWLADQRANWRYLREYPDHRRAPATGPADAVPADGSVAQDAPAEASWQNGTIAERVEFLEAAREQDPDTARDRLMAGWSKESATHRERLIKTLWVGLGPADEDFLERALDDRRREVRQAAMELLGKLPGSAYCQRMVERVRAAVRPDGTGTLLVDPPADCDAAMLRDGIDAKPPSGVGARAWWLQQIVARTPLPTWLEMAPDPAGFLSLTVADDWWKTLHRGLTIAVARERDPEWARQLLAVLRRSVTEGPVNEQPAADQLYHLLPAAELAEYARERLLRDKTRGYSAHRMLSLCPAPWPAALGTAALDRVAELLDRANEGYQITRLCRLIATRLPPTAAESVDALVAALRDEHPDNVNMPDIERLAQILHFRQKMTEELA